MRNKEQLRDLLTALYDPSSTLYRRWLTVPQFTRQFSPAQKDYEAVMRFFRAQGLTVTHTAPNRYLFQVEGSAADVERVLHLRLNLYRHPSENREFMAPDREPTLALKVPVQEIIGLEDFILSYPKYRAPETREASRGKGGSGPKGWFIGSDFRAAYYGSGKSAKLDGSGQSVGLLELGPYDPSDVSLYFSTVGQTSTVPVNPVSVDGTQATCSPCHDGEQILDIVYTASMAPGLDQVQVYVGKKPVDVENQMAAGNTSKLLSISWGYGEHFETEDAIYQEMAAQGQSLFIASGDFSSLKKSGPWPEEDANVIAVGGTDLKTHGPGGSWKAESAWKYSAAGPSLDHNILIEAYQLPYINKKNQGSTKCRNVADVSANGDFDMLLCSNGHCNGGWGGTSFSSPMWAGFAALMNQYASQRGKPAVGFLNPTLYGLLGGNRRLTRDVVGGDNTIYPAVKGYDLVGGVGSPNGMNTIKTAVGD